MTIVLQDSFEIQLPFMTRITDETSEGDALNTENNTSIPMRDFLVALSTTLVSDGRAPPRIPQPENE